MASTSAKTPAPEPTRASRPYHHGHLRAALIAAALEVIAEQGPASLSLRELARRAGVSHAAPAHHFGDKTGLLTVLATEGYNLLADATSSAWSQTGSFLEVGVAYVRFATTHPAHFAVMFRPDLHRADDPALTAARQRARAALRGPASKVAGSTGADSQTASLAAWSLMHGLATLWLNGNVPADTGADPEALARAIGAYLFIPGTGQRPQAATETTPAHDTTSAGHAAPRDNQELVRGELCRVMAATGRAGDAGRENPVMPRAMWHFRASKLLQDVHGNDRNPLWPKPTNDLEKARLV